MLRVFIGVSGTFVLIAAVSTSMSGAGRLAYSLAKHDMLPHAFARLNRRTLFAPSALDLHGPSSARAPHHRGRSAASPCAPWRACSRFGVLLAFTAAQVAVIRLRFTEPDLERPFRAPLDVRVRGTPVPLLALIGAPLTFAIWVVSLVTHPAARIVGPLWLLAGVVIFVARPHVAPRAACSGGSRRRSATSTRSRRARTSGSSSR